MDSSEENISDLMLDLSLAASFPINVDGRNKTRAIAAVNAMGFIAETLPNRKLRELSYSVGPLIVLLDGDIDEPIAAKAAFGIRSLMPSRVCMRELIAKDGLKLIGRIFDDLLSADRNIDLKVQSVHRSVLENLCGVYKEISVPYPWDVVRVSGIRHCVTMLRRGDAALQTIAVGTLAALCADPEICKQVFRTGATKPIINVSDADVTNEPCMLAGLGCITQLSRIPEIGIKIGRQGVVKVLEKALDRKVGVAPHVVREKALYALHWLSRIPQIRHVLATKHIIDCLGNQLYDGTVEAKSAAATILMHLHNKYPREHEVAVMRRCRDAFIAMLGEGQWHHRNLVIKAMCVLYRENEDKLYFSEYGVIERLFEIMEAKPEDLTEAATVLMLSFCSHPDLPWVLMDKGALQVICQVYKNVDVPVISDLLRILLKGLALYDWDRVMDAIDEWIPVEKGNLKQIESPECSLFGSEYGGLIQEYMQNIVQNRRNQKYLLDQLGEDIDLEQLGVSEALLEAYQNSFMELDLTCRGFLEIDALKVIIVLRGEVLDDDELIDIFNEYDPERTGRMDFRQFMQLMKDWKNRFGLGAKALVNQATNSGPIGRARRMFGRWWNKQKLAQKEIDRIKRKKEEERLRTQQLAAKFLTNEDLNKKRDAMEKSRKSEKSPLKNSMKNSMKNSKKDQGDRSQKAHSEDAFSDYSSPRL